jgi:hypothetical protein
MHCLARRRRLGASTYVNSQRTSPAQTQFGKPLLQTHPNRAAYSTDCAIDELSFSPTDTLRARDAAAMSAAAGRSINFQICRKQGNRRYARQLTAELPAETLAGKMKQILVASS